MSRCVDTAGQARVRERSTINTVTGCWRWIGASRGVGYGALKVDGQVIDAHRYAWLVFNGPIPAGMQVLHKCDNRACVNPAHLELGNASKNRADAIARGAVDPGVFSRRRRIPPAQLAMVIGDYDGGVSLRQLVVKYGIPATTLRRLLVANGRRLPGASSMGGNAT
jgi:hypothetical protein